MKCQFCNNEFSNKQNLNYHQKKTKYCLKIQGKLSTASTFKCTICHKEFMSGVTLRRHQKNCTIPNGLQKYIEKIKEENLLLKKELEIKHYKEQLEKLKEEICKSQEESRAKIALLENTIKELREDKKQLQASYENIATTSILNDKDKIVKLTKKYVRKRPRQQFDERNVVYIITTPSLKKERRYILGKATNLTNRLSTYNKTDEHEVVFYKSCNSKEMMSCIENMIFNKLSRYREQANRERFILPENQEISLFYNTIEECINFFS